MVKYHKLSCCMLYIFNQMTICVECQFDQQWDAEIQKRNLDTDAGETVEKCGMKPSNKKASARIVNGKSTSSKSHPWTAQIFHMTFGPNNERRFAKSSGTIISNMAIISCRHCICNAATPILKDYVNHDTGYYENIPTSFTELPSDKHTCLKSYEGTKYPSNQNRAENIVNYHIATNFEILLSSDEFRDNIKAYLYEYDPEWILDQARQRVKNNQKPGTEAVYGKTADISIIIDVKRLNLQPGLSSPICLPVPASFHADTNAEVGIDVIVAGRGQRYGQHIQTNPSTKKMEIFTNCYTNEGMVRKNHDETSNEPHIFIPCQDYTRIDETRIINRCIPYEKGTVNKNELDESIEYISTDTDITFTTQRGFTTHYNIERSKDDNCYKYMKSAKEYMRNMDQKKLLQLPGDRSLSPDIIIIVNEEVSEEKLAEISEQWATKGTGPGVRCFNFAKLSRYGICKTASTKYSWGFCSRSCSVGKNFGFVEDITRDEVGLEMAEFKYYDDPAALKGWLGEKLSAIPKVRDGDDNSKKKILFFQPFSIDYIFQFCSIY